MQKNKSMNTATISAEINATDVPIFEALFKRLKAKKIVIKQEKDDTKMSQKEFFAMIDKRRTSKSVEMSMDEMQKILLGE